MAVGLREEGIWDKCWWKDSGTEMFRLCLNYLT